jgi:hypothetical protein
MIGGGLGKMADEGYRWLTNLGDDWWQSVGACQVLSDVFSRHLLTLFVSYEVEGERNRQIYTGFLLHHSDTLFWVTAGHVIDCINKILADSSYKVLAMRWCDGCEIRGAESVVVHNRDLWMFSTWKYGVDFAVAIITGLDAANILNNDRVRVLTEEVWRKVHLAQPEGYYLVGYPQEWVEISTDLLSDGRVLGSLRANLACLPLRRIEYPGPDPTDEFWNDPEAFYGEILAFTDGPGYQPGDISGMSGGPVISLERDPDSGIRYRLFGVQRSWKSEERLIRAEPIHRIIDIIGG